MLRPQEGGGHAERGDRLDGRAGDFQSSAPAHDEAHDLPVGDIEALRFEVFARMGFDHANSGKRFVHDHHEHGRFLLFARAGGAHFPADDNDRNETKREDDEGDQREAPIEPEEHYPGPSRS